MLLAWPVVICEACGGNLTTEPKGTEKGLDTKGSDILTDFCPKCGKGYQVWPVVPTPSVPVRVQESQVASEVSVLVQAKKRRKKYATRSRKPDKE